MSDCSTTPPIIAHRRGLAKTLLTALLTVAAAAGAAAEPPGAARYARGAAEIAGAYHLAPALVLAVIAVESAFNPHAVSPRGARGLMQLLPGTARDLGITQVFDPWENVEGGTRHLRRLLDEFGGDLVLALAAYNAGAAAVRRHGGVPPFPETRRYVDAVLGRLRGGRAGGVAARVPVPAGVRPAQVALAVDLGPGSPDQTRVSLARLFLEDARRHAARGAADDARVAWERARRLDPGLALAGQPAGRRPAPGEP